MYSSILIGIIIVETILLGVTLFFKVYWKHRAKHLDISFNVFKEKASAEAVEKTLFYGEKLKEHQKNNYLQGEELRTLKLEYGNLKTKHFDNSDSMMAIAWRSSKEYYQKVLELEKQLREKPKLPKEVEDFINSCAIWGRCE